MSRIDEIMKSKAEQFRMEPVADSWSAIQKELSKDKGSPSGKLFLRIAATIVLLLTAYWAGFESASVSDEEILAEAKKIADQTVQDQLAKTRLQDNQENPFVAEITPVKPIQKDLKMVKPETTVPEQVKISEDEKDEIVEQRIIYLSTVASVKPELDIYVAKEPELAMISNLPSKNGNKLILRDEAIAIIKQAKEFEALEYYSELRNAKNELLSLNFQQVSKRLKTQN